MARKFLNLKSNKRIRSGGILWMTNRDKAKLIPTPEPPPASFILDTHPMFAAYDVAFQLKADQVQMLLVREDGGGVEAWIGPAAGVLDEVSLLAHTGSNSGFVVTEKDAQNLAATLDATQATTGNQPQIVNSGMVLTLNGKPSMVKQSNSTILETGIITANQPNTMFTVGQMDSGDTRVMFGGTGATRNQLYLTGGNVTMLAGTTVAQTGGADAQHLWTTLFNGVSSILRQDGVQTGSGDVGAWNPDKITLMNFSGGPNAANYLQSHLFANSDQTANFAAIETALNALYGAYV